MSDKQLTQNIYRTHNCDQLTKKDIGQNVRLAGWVNSRRDHGGLIFIDLRDRWGITQLTFGPSQDKSSWQTAESLRNEYVISVSGNVAPRPSGMINKNIKTGEIEIEVTSIRLLSKSKTPPFPITEDTSRIAEETRLKYRFLDLRTQRMQRNIQTRHQLLQHLRHFYYSRDFIEIETPILIKGTPEGAREYVVPSRLYPGRFYVLPQSPQQLKQLSMVAGFDKYMQIARCFRDEDQRGDRQPEFTQVDVEMSFVEAEDVLALTEQCLIFLTKQLRPDMKILATPFPRLTWDEAMAKYGSDKPDLRFDLPMTDISDICQGCGFSIFSEAIKQNKIVQALRVPQAEKFSRSVIDQMTQIATDHGAKGLAWIKVKPSTSEGVPAAKLGADKVQEIISRVAAKPGDIIFFTADKFTVASASLGAVRLAVAEHLNLFPPDIFAYCCVTDFPLFEESEDGKNLSAMHHLFTRPKDEDINKIESDPLSVRAQAYDVVLNGNEIAGGSIRIHEPDLQNRVFTALGISARDAQARFGHMLKAFQYGTPPHGGIAWGFDRLSMLFCREPTIREVIAYPKDSKAKDLMLGAPAPLPKQQLSELHLKFDLDD